MKRIILVIVCVVLIFTAVPVSVDFYAKDNASVLSQFPSYVTEKQKEENNLKKRLPKFDNYMNAIGYENEDGTETVFVYNTDVKYKDENGVVKDKDVNLVSTGLIERLSGYTYETKSSDIKIFFAEEMSQDKGIKILYEGNEIKLTPKLEQENQKAQLKKIDKRSMANVSEKVAYGDASLNNVVQYDRVINEYTHLRFEANYSGLKEDIVLDKYTGTNRFTFIADFDTLLPLEYNKGVVISDKDIAVMEIPPVYMEDSGGEHDQGSRFSIDNTIEVSPLSNGKYEITIIVDHTFLTNPNTVYPVTIDPSLNIASSNHIDAPVYENYPSENWGNQIRNCVGNDSNMGTGYFYTKFNLSALSNVRYDNIISAYYSCRELTGQSANSVVETYLPFQDWSETGVNWNNKPACNWEKLGAVNVNGNDKGTHENYWYDFYITAAVMAWRQGVPNYGIAFKERTNSNWKAFGSKEYSSYLPYLVVTYVSESEVPEGLGLVNGAEYYIKNKRSGKYLTCDSVSMRANINQQPFIGGERQKWVINYQDDGYYEVSPASNTSYVIDVYGGGGDVPSGNMNEANIFLYTDGNRANQRWKIVRNWNGTYRFLSKFSSDSRAMVVQQAQNTSGANIFLFDYSTDYMYNDDWTLEPVNLGDADFYSFTNEGEYGIDTTQDINIAANLASNIGFNAYDLVNCDAQNAYNYMKEDGLWYFTGHGNTGFVVFNSLNNGVWTDSYISASGSNNSSNNYMINLLPANELNNLKLAVFSSCKTGENYEESNMIGNMFKRGTHYVIGHTNYTYVGPDYVWMVRFMMALDSGNCIYDAMEQADAYLYASGYGSTVGYLNQRHTLGDGSIVLKH